MGGIPCDPGRAWVLGEARGQEDRTELHGDRSAVAWTARAARTEAEQSHRLGQMWMAVPQGGREGCMLLGRVLGGGPSYLESSLQEGHGGFQGGSRQPQSQCTSQ